MSKGHTEKVNQPFRRKSLKESNDLRIRTDTELRAPLFGNDFRETGHACFRHPIIYLAATSTSTLTLSVLTSAATYALPLTPLVLLMLMMFLGSPSLTRKYGAAARTSLKGAVLCRAMMVSHCLCVIYGRFASSVPLPSIHDFAAYLMYHSILKHFKVNITLSGN